MFSFCNTAHVCEASYCRFGRDDLPLVAKVADMAHTWIFQQKQEDSNGSKEKK